MEGEKGAREKVTERRLGKEGLRLLQSVYNVLIQHIAIMSLCLRVALFVLFSLGL